MVGPTAKGTVGPYFKVLFNGSMRCLLFIKENREGLLRYQLQCLVVVGGACKEPSCTVYPKRKYRAPRYIRATLVF